MNAAGRSGRTRTGSDSGGPRSHELSRDNLIKEKSLRGDQQGGNNE